MYYRRDYLGGRRAGVGGTKKRWGSLASYCDKEVKKVKSKTSQWKWQAEFESLAETLNPILKESKENIEIAIEKGMGKPPMKKNRERYAAKITYAEITSRGESNKENKHANANDITLAARSDRNQCLSKHV